LKKKKSQKDLVTAIILTYNEEKNVKNCLKSIYKIVDKIIVVDSFSSDKTLKICKKFKKIKIFQRKFKDQANQMNWVLKNVKIKTKWILRVDADEYFEKNSKKNFIKILNEKNNFNGIVLKRKIKFLGKIINYGLTSPHYTLRIWQNGKGFYPNVIMDEQVFIKGKTFVSNLIIIDENLKGFIIWLKKHIDYASREARQYLFGNQHFKIKDNSKSNKINKLKIYYKFPILIRPLLLFFYSYIYKRGFLSGYQGFIFYFFQNFVYRMLVDINIIALKLNVKKKCLKLEF